MEELLFTKIPVVATLTAVFFLLTAAQTLHALFLAARKNARPVSAATVYEALLVVHLYLWQPPPCCRHTPTTAPCCCTCA